MQAFDDLARGLIMSLAASLHLPADAFQPTLDNAELYCKQSASTLEAIHDMLPESQAVQLNTPEACREHKDKGVLNLTYSDTEQGLWVCFSRKLPYNYSAVLTENKSKQWVHVGTALQTI